jgi:FMN reductase
MQIAVVTGNPKPRSRTLAAGIRLATAIGGGSPQVVVDLAVFGTALLTANDLGVAMAIKSVQQADVAIVASPTFKASYTGMLKLFLDQFPADGLAGVVAIPLMLGAGPAHALAPELLLKPVLVELGATCPTRALYQLDRDFAKEGAMDAWLAGARSQILNALRSES